MVLVVSFPPFLLVVMRFLHFFKNVLAYSHHRIIQGHSLPGEGTSGFGCLEYENMVYVVYIWIYLNVQNMYSMI